MPGQLRNVVLGAVAATVIAGCGSEDGTIPAENSETLIARLQAIDDHVSQGQCVEAAAQAETFASDVQQLPGSVDDEVQQGLEESASQLVSLTSSECEPPDGATGAGGAVTTETEPTTTEETTTETTTEETTTEEPADEEPPEQQDDEPQQDQDLAPPDDAGPGGGSVGSDGGVGPSGGVGSGGDE